MTSQILFPEPAVWLHHPVTGSSLSGWLKRSLKKAVKSVREVSPSEGHVSTLSSINLFGTLCQITRVRNTAQT